jgi:hypothetical protein
VNGPAFAKWRKAVDAANAAKKEAETLKEVCGFPDTESLRRLLGVTEWQTKGAAVIVDGNGKPVGKVSVFFKDAFVMPAGFSSRVS